MSEEVWKQGWEERVGAFAAKVGKTSEEIAEALKPKIGEPGQSALDALASDEFTPFADFDETLVKGLGIPVAMVRMHLNVLRGTKPVEVAQPGAASVISVLPKPTDEESFIDALRYGGVLKFNTATLEAAIKAALADRLGLYDIPERLVDEMARRAEEMSEPFTEDYFKIRKVANMRSYSELFAAMEDRVPPNYISEGVKRKFLAKLEQYMWGPIESFHRQLVEWMNTWSSTTMGNPGMLMAALAGGKMGTAFPTAALFQYPDTSGLKASAEAMNDQFNKIFSGDGVIAAKALGIDANRVIELLKDERLPTLIGAGNREEMLRKIGVKAPADYRYLEKSLIQYVLAIIKLPEVPAGDQEQNYIIAMLQSGTGVKWDLLKDDGDRRRLPGKKSSEAKEHERY